MMVTVIITFTILLVGIAGMALGVWARKDKSHGGLRGSCGGPEINPDCCMKTKNDCSDQSPTKAIKKS